jgi:hypothetical protein
VPLPFPLPKRSLSYDHKGTIPSPMNSRFQRQTVHLLNKEYDLMRNL